MPTPGQRPPRHRRNWRSGRFGNLWLKIAIAVAIVGVFGLLYVVSIAMALPDPNRLTDREVAQSTKIYDRKGETILYDIHGEEKRTIVRLDELPKYVAQATISVEDRNFYRHKGISITGIIRSFYRNVTTGSRVGGSTLTQQLIKNAILTNEKAYTRKLKEVILAYQIENRFTKEEILQLYFNEIPYGSTAYGIEAASQTYFGKSARDLTLAEAAVLAAIPQAPTYYSPYGTHKDALINRQHYALDSMAELGYITTEDAALAKKEELTFKPKIENIVAPHFVMHVREYLTEKYGEVTVEQGGLKVITTLDIDKQKLAEQAIADQAEKNLTWKATNAALVALDPKTGQILAMVGSKDFFNEEIDGQVNVTTRLRQPGSSFKPIAYAAAFRKGFTPDTVLYDVNTSFINTDGRNYEPKNYNFSEHGPVSMRAALAGSLNIPAVKTLYLAGIDNVLTLAQQLGYSSLQDRSRYGLSLVLGGGEVTLLEHAAAYAVFAREGEYHPPVAILEVRDKNNNILEEYKEEKKGVLEPQVARQVNSILTDNAARAFVFGAANRLTLPDRLVAAKTGTTNDFHDAWTMGFTPSLVTGVWVGNSNNDAMKAGADGSVVAAPIWNQFMRGALVGTPAEGFTAPEPTTSEKPAITGAIAQGIKVKVDRVSGKLATNLTPESTIEERTYQQVHDILWWVNPSDPLGETPPDRESAQAKRWEEAVQRWAAENDIVSQDPPTEYDDVHTGQEQPTISIVYPAPGQSITSRSFTAQVNANSPRGVRRVVYALNGKIIGTSTSAPFDLRVELADPTLRIGEATLTATAYDDVDNAGTSQISVQLALPSIATTLQWITPTSGARVTKTNFPLQIQGTLSSTTGIEKIDVFARSGSETTYINTARQFPQNVLMAYWANVPAAGQYQIYAHITNTDGFGYDTAPIEVTVQ
jgi:1A family penicillin-binding protein